MYGNTSKARQEAARSKHTFASGRIVLRKKQDESESEKPHYDGRCTGQQIHSKAQKVFAPPFCILGKVYAACQSQRHSHGGGQRNQEECPYDCGPDPVPDRYCPHQRLNYGNIPEEQAWPQGAEASVKEKTDENDHYGQGHARAESQTPVTKSLSRNLCLGLADIRFPHNPPD